MAENQELIRLRAAMKAIQMQLDLVEWSADTLDNIADIVRLVGYQVRDTDTD